MWNVKATADASRQSKPTEQVPYSKYMLQFRIYFLKVLDFQRPSDRIWEADNPCADAKETAPIRKLCPLYWSLRSRN